VANTARQQLGRPIGILCRPMFGPKHSSFLFAPLAIQWKITPLEEWKKLFLLSEQYGFVIASDECYSETIFR
jgi:hypothetical protein